MITTLGRDQGMGLLIVNIEEGSPASSGGLMVGDILVGMEGKSIADHDELMVIMTGQAVGELVSIQVLRGGQLKTIPVKIGERK